MHYFRNQLSGGLVNVFDWHKLLVEQNVPCDGWSFHSHNIANVLENDEPKWKVLPEKPRVEVELYLTVTCRDHGEGYSTVAQVGVENSLEAAVVCDLSVVHLTNSFAQGHYLIEVDVWELL